MKGGGARGVSATDGSHGQAGRSSSADRASVGLVPVVARRSPPTRRSRAIDAIRAGGVDVLEITMTVPGAVGSSSEIARSASATDAIVGAGTVLDAETARACILAGARFVVSPALDLGHDRHAAGATASPVLPGALTPTEVLAAWKAGADVVKVFPCGALGGAELHQVPEGAAARRSSSIPTGGVSVEDGRRLHQGGRRRRSAWAPTSWT